MQSIQSLLPRPENRSRDQIARDVEDEIAFHLEMKTRAIEAEDGVDHEAACGLARQQFGDVQRIEIECQRIALKERIVLQRVNFVMMVIVMLLVVGVGVMVLRSQSKTADALEMITKSMTEMQQADAAIQQLSSGGGMIYIEGDVPRPGTYALPPFGTMTLRRALVAAGAVRGEGFIDVVVRQTDAQGRTFVRFEDAAFDLDRRSERDFVLSKDDHIIVGRPGKADPARSNMPADQRAAAVGEFVMRLFTLADPNNPNLDQTIRDFLDSEEKSLDAKYADDPATAGMIRELIAARRKIFDADAGFRAAATAEQKTRAVTDFLNSVLAPIDPQQLGTLPQQVLAQVNQHIDEIATDNPNLAAELRERLQLMKANPPPATASAPGAVAAGNRIDLDKFVQKLMTASIPNAAAAHLPRREELDLGAAAIEASYAHDPTLLKKLRSMIATVQQRLDAEDKARAVAANNQPPDQDAPRLAPFSAVRWQNYTPFVQINGTWGELLSINDIPVDEIMAFCRATYGERDRKRFTEDLVQAMTDMGKPTGPAGKLQIKELRSGSVISIENAPMTEANRRQLWEANTAAADAAPGYPTWTGEPPAIEQPQARANDADAPVAKQLTAEQADEDLAALADAMRSRFSYLHLNGVDLDAALAATRSEIGDAPSVSQFALATQRMIARFGDGHAGVSGFAAHGPPAHAPFQMRDAGGAEGEPGRVAAMKSDSSELLDEAHPYVVAINGVAIEDVLAEAGAYVADGSPALKRRRSIRIAHSLGLIAALGQLDASAPVSITLASADGTSTSTLDVGPPVRSPDYRDRPDRSSGKIDGDVGYLRIAEMDDEAARMVRWVMPQFKQARGVIIDVRGNGGGSRDALLALLPYLLAPDSPPQVLNVAAYRLSPDFSDDHLAARFMHRVDDARWTDAERRAIAACAAQFKPQWTPPAGQFSDWHYLVVSRDAAAASDSGLYYFDKPVIVLMDGDCFSATDIFLGALKNRTQRITLLGTCSSGGSGRKQSVRLPNSGLTISLSSMVSYQPDGTMYDRTGIPPDVVVEPIATDFVIEGATDTQLDAALARLRAK